MKFKDPITGEYKTLHLKTSDTLPVGTIVSFEGDEIPEGYEEVIGEEARVVISPTEPTTGEEVWIDNVNKKIYIKNDNDVYEEIYNEKGKIDMKILWPNPSPSVAIEESEIDVDYSGCDYYEIIYKQYYLNNFYHNTGKIPVGTQFRLITVNILPSSNVASFMCRDISPVSNNKLKFYKCVGGTIHSDNTNFLEDNLNQYCIPIYVIGYKMK